MNSSLDSSCSVRSEASASRRRFLTDIYEQAGVKEVHGKGEAPQAALANRVVEQFRIIEGFLLPMKMQWEKKQPFSTYRIEIIDVELLPRDFIGLWAFDHPTGTRFVKNFKDNVHVISNFGFSIAALITFFGVLFFRPSGCVIRFQTSHWRLCRKPAIGWRGAEHRGDRSRPVSPHHACRPECEA